MKTIILLIALVLSNLGFSCEILPNGKYIPCNTAAAEIMCEKAIEQRFKQGLGRFAYDKAEIENVKTNIEYNVKLAESRLNEAEVRYVESIKKYKTTRHNANSKSFIKQKVYSEIAKQKSYPEIAKQKVYSEITFAKQKAHSEMRIAEFEYEKARRECGRIYAIAKGESTSFPVGKSPSEIFKLIK